MHLTLRVALFVFSLMLALHGSVHAQVTAVKGNYLVKASSLPTIPTSGRLWFATANSDWSVANVWKEDKITTVWYLNHTTGTWKQIPSPSVTGEWYGTWPRVDGDVCSLISLSQDKTTTSLYGFNMRTETLTRVISLGDILTLNTTGGQAFQDSVSGFSYKTPLGLGFLITDRMPLKRGFYRGTSQVLPTADYTYPEAMWGDSSGMSISIEHGGDLIGNALVKYSNPMVSPSSRSVLLTTGQKFLEYTVVSWATARPDATLSRFYFAFQSRQGLPSGVYDTAGSVQIDGTPQLVHSATTPLEWGPSYRVNRVLGFGPGLAVLELASNSTITSVFDRVAVFDGQKTSAVVQIGDVVDGQTVTGIGPTSAYGCTAEIPLFFADKTTPLLYQLQKPCITSSPTGDVQVGASVTVKGQFLSFPGHVTTIVDENGVVIIPDSVSSDGTSLTFSAPSSGATFKVTIDGVVSSNAVPISIIRPVDPAKIAPKIIKIDPWSEGDDPTPSPGKIGMIKGNEFSRVRTSLFVPPPFKLPLPTTLAGTEVRVDGKAVPLYYVYTSNLDGYSEIRFVFPDDMKPGKHSIVVNKVDDDGNVDIAGIPFEVTSVASAGNFVHPANYDITLVDKNWNIAAPDKPIKPGLYTATSTGSGLFLPQADGTMPQVTITLNDVECEVLYAGPLGTTPENTYPGFEQYNFRVPEGVEARDYKGYLVISVGNTKYSFVTNLQ